jgi:hypothetical protein
MRTIALLLPEPAKSTKSFFKNQQKEWKKRKALDPEVIKCGVLKDPDRQIEKFDYWRERLEILKQVFDDEEPATIKRWWFDRRKKVQWYTSGLHFPFCRRRFPLEQFSAWREGSRRSTYYP